MNITIRLIEYRGRYNAKGKRTNIIDHGTLLSVFPSPGPLVGDRIDLADYLFSGGRSSAGSSTVPGGYYWVVCKRVWKGIGCEPATLEVVVELDPLESEERL